MKLSFKNLLNIIKKHKYIFLGIFVVLILILFTSKPLIEGLTIGSSIGEYDYLAPVPKDNTISDATIKAVIEYLNKTNCPNGTTDCKQYADPNDPNVIERMKKNYSGFAVDSELQYYAKNGKYPYSGYVVDYITNHPDIIPGGQNLSDIQKRATNRMFYHDLIAPKEKALDPQPLSYQIFTGTASPPNSSITSSSMFSNPLASKSSSGDSNYQDFVNLCKKVVSQ